MIFLIESGIILNRDIWEIGAAGAQLPYKQTVTGSNPVSPTINYMPRFCVAFLFWAFSSAGEHFLHTEGVIGSIPVTPTICFKVRLRRTFFVINAMTLRGILTVQMPLQARWTCEARLARAFTASALVGIPLAVSTNYGSLLTPFGRTFPEGASFETSPSSLISLCFK